MFSDCHRRRYGAERSTRRVASSKQHSFYNFLRTKATIIYVNIHEPILQLQIKALLICSLSRGETNSVTANTNIHLATCIVILPYNYNLVIFIIADHVEKKFTLVLTNSMQRSEPERTWKESRLKWHDGEKCDGIIMKGCRK